MSDDRVYVDIISMAKDDFGRWLRDCLDQGHQLEQSLNRARSQRDRLEVQMNRWNLPQRWQLAKLSKEVKQLQAAFTTEKERERRFKRVIADLNLDPPDVYAAIIELDDIKDRLRRPDTYTIDTLTTSWDLVDQADELQRGLTAYWKNLHRFRIDSSSDV